MRDRLIELLDIIIQPGEKTLGDIADHLLANGVVVPPCKVGDVVYCEKNSKIYEGIVDGIHYTTRHEDFGICVYVEKYYKDPRRIGKYLFFHFEDFNKTIFLTREEAERALKGEAE